MPGERLDQVLSAELADMAASGSAKGDESIVTEVLAPRNGLGRRYLLEGHQREFLRMNSNSYLGLSSHPAVVGAEEAATRRFGAGPGAVRFISGTYQHHLDLERRVAGFHGRESAVVFSSAYAAVLSTLSALITDETLVLSDELNHSCIINGIKMTRPVDRAVYPHLDMGALDSILAEKGGEARRAVVVTDGVFSMRGDFVDLASLAEVVDRHDHIYPENVVVVVDDSHGVGAYGVSGRGTEEVTGGRADVLIGTLGKAFGVNGGYVAGSATITRYLRERGPMYIYSNPITPGEAAAADMAVSILDSPEGAELLAHLAALTTTFESGLVAIGYETIPGPHPVVPLMIRDTQRTAEIVRHLFDHGVLATGLNHPVVPKGDEEIRFQVNADHTEADIAYVLEVLAAFSGAGS